MKKKILQEIKDFLIKDVGGDLYPLFEHLDTEKYINEFDLAEKLDLEVNKVRSLLYKLHELHLANFKKERDPNKGWFIFSWKLNLRNLRTFLIKKRMSQIENLKRRIEELKLKELFQCNECGEVYSPEDAVENNFFCPVCGSMLVPMKKDFILNEMKERIKVLEEEVNKIKKVLKE